jgi:hypothetical protein
MILAQQMGLRKTECGLAVEVVAEKERPQVEAIKDNILARVVTIRSVLKVVRCLWPDVSLSVGSAQ